MLVLHGNQAGRRDRDASHQGRSERKKHITQRIDFKRTEGTAGVTSLDL